MWKQLTSNNIILGYVKGVQIPVFVDIKSSNLDKNEIQFSKEERKLVKEEIRSFLERGIISRVKESELCSESVISNIFLRMKPDGSQRMILNLSKFNKTIPKTHFKMDTLEKALKLVKPGCFFCKLDLKDAYFAIPVSESSKKLLRFRFNSELFQFEVIPQGYRDSPRIFTKLVKVPLAFLRSLGHIISGYLDDLILLGFCFQDCVKNAEETTSLFTALGFAINYKKSIFTPETFIEYLGFIIDSISMTVRPTLHKCSSITNAIKDILKLRTITIRKLSEIIGKLCALIPGNTYALLYIKMLEIFRNKQLKIYKGNYESQVVLNKRCVKDLHWWISNIDNYPKAIQPPKFVEFIETDACTSVGWGSWFKGIRTGGVWSAEDRENNINVLELLAAKLSLQSFCKQIYNRNILIKTDSTTVIACVNKMGSSIPVLNKISREIWEFAISHDIFIAATFIPGVENVRADKESRNKTYFETEWSLNSEVFNIVNDKFGPFDIDLMASRLNFKIDPYVSWRSDPGARFCNAYLLPDWNIYFSYCFPPFNQINRVLQKVIQDKCCMCIIVPRCTTQAFWPVLKKLLVQKPLELPWRRDLLTNPVIINQIHPLVVKKKLTLLACLVSGKNI